MDPKQISSNKSVRCAYFLCFSKVGTKVANKSDEKRYRGVHMTKALMITLFSLLSVVSFAQQQEDYNIEKIERNISRSHEKENETAQEEYSDAMNEAYETQNSPQINIYNANSNANKQNQKAKSESEAEAANDNTNDNTSDMKSDMYTNAEVGNEYITRANDVRKARKNLEIGTEQKMVEKIEWSRMEDEKDRADRLFGNRLDRSYKQEETAYVPEKPAYQEKPVYAEKPAYVAPVAPVYEVKTEEKEDTKWWGQEAYVAPMLGTQSYSADNVRPGAAYGVAVGARLDSNISVEGSFLYSDLEMDDYRVGYNGFTGLKEVTQYGFGGAVKYNFEMGRLSPFIGALGTYTMRDYQEVRVNNGTAESTAWDLGLTLGVDVKVAKNFSLGVEYRAMRNISNDVEEDSSFYANQRAQQFQRVTGKTLEPLEEVSQSLFLVNGKFSF